MCILRPLVHQQWRSPSGTFASQGSEGRVSERFPFKGIYTMISAECCPIIGHQYALDRQTVGRWHFIKETLADRRRISAAFDQSSPDNRLIINVGLCYIVYNACIHIMIHLFYFGIHFVGPGGGVLSGFCVGFPIKLFVCRFEINASTSPKILQPYSEHSLIYYYAPTSFSQSRRSIDV